MTINEAKAILGLTQSILISKELKKKFKELMLQWHPDIALNTGVSEQEATSKSQQIILAYEILSKNLESLDESSFQHSYESYYKYRTSSDKSYKQHYDHSIDNIDASFVNRITLNSSNVKWIDYMRDLKILVVRFKGSGGYYLYHNVPEYIFDKFKITDSPGRFVHENLYIYKYESLNQYADWLNVYKSLNEITDN